MAVFNRIGTSEPSKATDQLINYRRKFMDSLKIDIAFINLLDSELFAIYNKLDGAINMFARARLSGFPIDWLKLSWEVIKTHLNFKPFYYVGHDDRDTPKNIHDDELIKLKHALTLYFEHWPSAERRLLSILEQADEDVSTTMNDLLKVGM